MATNIGLSVRQHEREKIRLPIEFIVCDEPSSALDVSAQAQILNLLMDLQRDLNFTYLFIAHDLAVVRHVSDRVAVMHQGKIIEIVDTSDLLTRASHPYTRKLISTALDPAVR